MRNLLYYKGEVTIKETKGNSIKINKTHNVGTAKFFEIIASALAGKNMSREMPKYLEVFYQEDDELESRCTRVPLPDNLPVVKTEVDYAFVEFVFRIVYTQFIKGLDTTTQYDINVLRLYNSQDAHVDDYLAEVVLDEPRTFDDTTNWLVSWKMFIGNALENENNITNLLLSDGIEEE